MSRIADIFGYRPEKRRQYIDLALTAVAVIATIWAMGMLPHPEQQFDFKIGLLAAAVALICTLLSSDSLMTTGAVTGYIAVRGFVGYAGNGDRRLLPYVLIAALLCLGVILWRAKHPTKR